MKAFIKITILLIIIVIAFTVSCRRYDREGAEKVTVILDWVPNTNHTGLYVAKELGFYQEEGLDIEIIQPTEGGSADLIAAGQGQFGISYQEQVTYALTAKNPLPILAIAAIIQNNTSGFASPKEKDITSPKDFENKRYGGWGSPMEEAMLKALMEKDGADFSKLEMIDIGASDFFTSISRDVDFAWIYYGWDGVAAELRDFDLNFLLLQDLDSSLNFYTPVIIANKQLIENDPELIESFLNATAKGYDFCVERPLEAAEILLKNVPELDRDMVLKSQEYLSKEYKKDSPKWGYMQEEIWQTFADWMSERDLLEKRLDGANAFTNRFLP
jgi:ABC-type nitrate/sulfonate/bicarbonate transport system substrate-binding protein